MAKKKKQSQPRPSTVDGYVNLIDKEQAALEAEQNTLSLMLVDYETAEPLSRGWKKSRIKGCRERIAASKVLLGQLRKELQVLKAKGGKELEQTGDSLRESGPPSPLTSIGDDVIDPALLALDGQTAQQLDAQQAALLQATLEEEESNKPMSLLPEGTTNETLAKFLAPSRTASPSPPSRTPSPSPPSRPPSPSPPSRTPSPSPPSRTASPSPPSRTPSPSPPSRVPSSQDPKPKKGTQPSRSASVEIVDYKPAPQSATAPGEKVKEEGSEGTLPKKNERRTEGKKKSSKPPLDDKGASDRAFANAMIGVPVPMYVKTHVKHHQSSGALFGMSCKFVALQVFINMFFRTVCHYHTRSAHGSLKNDSSRNKVTGVYAPHDKPVAPEELLEKLPVERAGTAPAMPGSDPWPDYAPTSTTNGLTIDHFLQFYRKIDGWYFLHCGCLLDDVLLDFFLWKSNLHVNSMYGHSEEYGSPLEPRARTWICAFIKTTLKTKVEMLYAYDENGNFRPWERRAVLQIKNLWQDLEAKASRSMVLVALNHNDEEEQEDWEWTKSDQEYDDEVREEMEKEREEASKAAREAEKRRLRELKELEEEEMREEKRLRREKKKEKKKEKREKKERKEKKKEKERGEGEGKGADDEKKKKKKRKKQSLSPSPPPKRLKSD